MTPLYLLYDIGGSAAAGLHAFTASAGGHGSLWIAGGHDDPADALAAHAGDALGDLPSSQLARLSLVAGPGVHQCIRSLVGDRPVREVVFVAHPERTPAGVAPGAGTAVERLANRLGIAANRRAIDDVLDALCGFWLVGRAERWRDLSSALLTGLAAPGQTPAPSADPGVDLVGQAGAGEYRNDDRLLYDLCHHFERRAAARLRHAPATPDRNPPC